MSIEEVLTYSGGGLLLLLTFVQISPIRFNPWSWLGRAIGRAINGEVLEKVNALYDDIQSLKKEEDEEWASLSRTHILRFGDELLHGIPHSKEHFDQILLDVSKYETYCDSHKDYKNNVATATIKQIKHTYQKCLDESNFL